MGSYEQTLYELMHNFRQEILARPINLGGTSIGNGGPPGGFVGFLPQSRVSYDPLEIASSGFPSSNPSLVINLNHIRARLETLETTSGTGLSDGDKGDITVSSSGSIWVIDNSVVSENKMILSDVTNLDVSTSGHGFFPKLPTSTGKYLKDDMTWDTPSGTGTVGGHTISFNTTTLTTRPDLHFEGGGVDISDDVGNDRTSVWIPSDVLLSSIFDISTWTWVDQGSCTYGQMPASYSQYGDYFENPATGTLGDVSLRCNPILTAPYEVIMHLGLVSFDDSAYGLSVGWYDSVGGELYGISACTNGDLRVDHWNSTTSYDTFDFEKVGVWKNTQNIWIKLVDDTTDKFIYISNDGRYWKLFDQRPVDAYLTDDNYFIGVPCGNAETTLLIYHYVERNI